MQKWEYRILNHTISDRWSSKRQAEEIAEFERILNEFGDDGWEMVSYQAVPLTGSIMTDKVKGYAYVAFFKAEVGD